MSLSVQSLIALNNLPKIGPKSLVNLMKYDELELISRLSSQSDAKDICLFLGNISSRYKYTFEQIIAASNAALQTVEYCLNHDIRILTIDSDLYPKSINPAFAKPPILYCKGNLRALAHTGITIIGSRKATAKGLEASTWCAKKLAAKGCNIISGLALGCDAAAHQGALNANGLTTAILGCGLASSVFYPKENLWLRNSILDNNGLLLSTYPPESSARPKTFVERDKLQAALGNATIVVQTRVNGGTMHAARETLDLNNPLLVIRYRTANDNFDGNCKLLEDNQVTPLSNENYQHEFERISSLCNREFQDPLFSA